MSRTNRVDCDVQWRKSRRSVSDGACVEVAVINGQIDVRDSKNPDGAWLRYRARSWRVFIAQIRNELYFG
jgi:hypothetical protein